MKTWNWCPCFYCGHCKFYWFLMAGSSSPWKNEGNAIQAKQIFRPSFCVQKTLPFAFRSHTNTQHSMKHKVKPELDFHEYTLKKWKHFLLLPSPNMRCQMACRNPPCGKVQLSILSWRTPGRQIKLAEWKYSSAEVLILTCMCHIYYKLSVSFYSLSHFMSLRSYRTQAWGRWQLRLPEKNPYTHEPQGSFPPIFSTHILRRQNTRRTFPGRSPTIHPMRLADLEEQIKSCNFKEISFKSIWFGGEFAHDYIMIKRWAMLSPKRI